MTSWTRLLLAGLLLWPLAACSAPKACLSDCTPRIGIVSAFGAEADILGAQTRGKRTWRVNGNRFTTGVLRGNRVVIVLSGVSMINAVMVTPLMLDHFRIERLIMSGIAGGIDPARHVGDVLIPERWSMPMEVYWSQDGSTPAPCGAPGDLACLGLKLATHGDGRPLPDFRLSDLAGAHEFNQDVGALFSSGLAESNEAAVTLAFLEAWAGEASPGKKVPARTSPR
jgi:adenosylhomocysteine nucleosidase